MSFSIIFLLLALFLHLVSNHSLSQTINNRPIIGVLTQPTRIKQKGESYIAASYVKFIESAGARTIPIPYDLTKEQRLFFANQINGILFPGGSNWLNGTGNPYLEAQNWWIQYSLSVFEAKQIRFPIFGICLGFEAIIASINQLDTSILKRIFNSTNVNLPLIFSTSVPLEKSKIFGLNNELFTSGLFNREQLIQLYSRKEAPIAFNNHVAGVLLQDWTTNSYLNAILQAVSTSVDLVGNEFVSVFESKPQFAPIFGTQFHPEKSAFEWKNSLSINHALESVVMNQFFAYFLVNESRQNLNYFSNSTIELNSLMYNFDPVYTAKTSKSEFEQQYFFPSASVFFSRITTER